VGEQQRDAYKAIVFDISEENDGERWRQEHKTAHKLDTKSHKRGLTRNVGL
jgi:hypothetical protein